MGYVWLSSSKEFVLGVKVKAVAVLEARKTMQSPSKSEVNQYGKSASE